LALHVFFATFSYAWAYILGTQTRGSSALTNRHKADKGHVGRRPRRGGHGLLQGGDEPRVRHQVLERRVGLQGDGQLRHLGVRARVSAQALTLRGSGSALGRGCMLRTRDGGLRRRGAVIACRAEAAGGGPRGRIAATCCLRGARRAGRGGAKGRRGGSCIAGGRDAAPVAPGPRGADEAHHEGRVVVVGIVVARLARTAARRSDSRRPCCC